MVVISVFPVSESGDPSVAHMKRRIWQIASTLMHNGYLPVFFNLGLYQGFLKGYCTPTLNCYACPGAFLSCPIGALQHFAARGQFPFFLVGFLGLVGMAVGRMTCGWLCPFGFLQDMMKKLSRRAVRMPRWMGKLKYVSLVVIALMLPILLGEPWFSKLCPAGGIQGAIPWALAGSSDSPAMEGFDVSSMIGTLFWIKMVILGILLLGMVFIKRPFCRAFCPLGAIFSLFNRLSVIRLDVDPERCDGCGFCEGICPVDLKVYEEVDSAECIKCLECTKCPAGVITLRYGLGGKT
jgi:ferredoxin-type protein NapH